MKFLPDILKMLKKTQKAISQLDFDENTQQTMENMSFSEFVNQIGSYINTKHIKIQLFFRCR